MGDRPTGARRGDGYFERCLASLGEAARLPTDQRNVIELRSLAARCLAGVDLRPAAVLAKGRNLFCAAYNPTGTLLAAGEYQGLGTCSVLLYDANERRLLRELKFPTDKKDTRKTGVRSLVFSPDGRWLAAGTRNGELHVWDLSQSPPARTSTVAHEETVTSLVFTADSRNLLTASSNRELKAWDPQRGIVLDTHRVIGDGISSIALSPNNNLLVCGNRECVSFVGLQCLSSHTDLPFTKLGIQRGEYQRVAFDPHGQVLATSYLGTLVLMNPGKWYESRSIVESDGGKCHTEEIKGLEFSPDGSLIVSASQDRTVKLWESASGRRVAAAMVPGQGNVHATFRPSGRELAIATEGQLAIYELIGQDSQTWLGATARPIATIALSPDGKRLAAASIAYHELSGGPDLVAELDVWNVDSGCLHSAHLSSHRDAPRSTASLCFDSSGHSVVWCSPYLPGTSVWNLDARKLSVSEERRATAVPRISPNSNVLWQVCDDNEVSRKVWPSGRELSRWSNAWASDQRGASALHDMCVGKNWVVVGSRDEYTKLLRASDGQMEKEWPSRAGAVYGVALSPDETVALSGTQTGVVQIVRVPSGEVMATLQAHRDRVHSVAFSPDGRMVATGARDRLVRLWRWDGSRLSELIDLAVGGSVLAVAFHRDGKRLAVLVQNETAVRIWHLDRLAEKLGELGIAW